MIRASRMSPMVASQLDSDEPGPDPVVSLLAVIRKLSSASGASSHFSPPLAVELPLSHAERAATAAINIKHRKALEFT